MIRTGCTLACIALCGVGAYAAEAWRFAVSGDSRNCGDIVMPAIADAARKAQAQFYWHLGDFRAIYTFDQDLLALRARDNSKPPMNFDEYLSVAWDDFIQHQLAPFGSLPVFLGIGNHELVAPKTRQEYVAEFAEWLDAAPIKQQRLRDNPADHRVRPYYHWIQDGIDFIVLDNASPEQFENGQLWWFESLLRRDADDADIPAIIVGMHAALPGSIADSHSMSDSPNGKRSGQRAYGDLLRFREGSHKPVYVLASHSHFYMAGVFNTEYWRTHGGVLPGWIIGTAGAERYTLPPDMTGATEKKEHVYGYLLATVRPKEEKGDVVQFDFKELSEQDLLAA